MASENGRVCTRHGETSHANSVVRMGEDCGLDNYFADAHQAESCKDYEVQIVFLVREVEIRNKQSHIHKAAVVEVTSSTDE